MTAPVPDYKIAPTEFIDPILMHTLQRNLYNAHSALEGYIRDHCPGPHQYTQHRDMRPAWCNACGRTAEGMHKSSYDRVRFNQPGKPAVAESPEDSNVILGDE